MSFAWFFLVLYITMSYNLTKFQMVQYDFPKQEAVAQFVIEAIQAEAFNPKTLFLIGSYTIGNASLSLSWFPMWVMLFGT